MKSPIPSSPAWLPYSIGVFNMYGQSITILPSLRSLAPLAAPFGGKAFLSRHLQ